MGPEGTVHSPAPPPHRLWIILPLAVLQWHLTYWDWKYETCLFKILMKYFLLKLIAIMLLLLKKQTPYFDASESKNNGYNYI